MEVNRLRENFFGWLIPALVSMAITFASGAVLWGQYSQRLAFMEEAQRQMIALRAQDTAKLATHDTQIALVNQKLDNIQAQLGHVDNQLEHISSAVGATRK